MTWSAETIEMYYTVTLYGLPTDSVLTSGKSHILVECLGFGSAEHKKSARYSVLFW